MQSHLKCVLAGIASLGPLVATASDYSLSGFGTLGYARSDQAFQYLRFIDKKGTLNRESVGGLQVDAKFTDTIGGTIQVKIAPSLKNDTKWDPTLSWAFLSWRPSNDLLIRLGKQRSPAYLYSESMDVGTTYDFARLPIEMYSLLASTDYIGASFSKTWNTTMGELTLDGYAGSMKSYWRFYQRDNIQLPGVPSQQGANFEPFTFTGGGGVLTLQHDEDRYRFGIHKVTGTTTAPVWRFPTRQTLAPAWYFVPPALAPYLGGSAYTILPEDYTKKVPTLTFTLSAEIKLSDSYRLIGEVSRRKATDVATGIDTTGGYISILKDIGRLTPYVTLAMLKSRSDVLNLYQTINNSPGVTALASIPAVLEAAATINASQRVIADGLSVYDQRTATIGVAYRLAPNQKFKFEWAQTHVGVASSLVDAPSGGDISNKNIHVLTFSYNIAF